MLGIGQTDAMLEAMPVRQKFILLGIVLFAAVLFFTGIDWGLPSRESDPFLFGNRTPWTGQQIMQLAGAWETEAARGADVAMHPLRGRDEPVVLNDTDAKRAEIVRRYRLYSNQPDEMITFRSLSRMKPGRLDFDPGMYQYGGLWIYPVGALLKLASMVHLVTLRTDLAFYLDHPGAFARFYLVARWYSAAWGILGVIVVLALGRELSGSFVVGAAAAGIYAAMPVVIDLAHEAKPHLAGTVLTLMTVLAGVRYVRTGDRKWWVLAGIFAGASVGMVLSGYAAFAVLPVMTMLRPIAWKRRFQITGGATLIGIAVFAVTNPYLPFNLLFHREVLKSNVGNSVAFYPPGLSIDGLAVAWRLLMEGTSIAPLIAGLIGAIVLSLRKKRIGVLPAAVAALVLIQFILLAGGKTAEYARFALTLDVILAICGAWLIDCLSITSREKVWAALLLVVSTLFFGLRYDINFVADHRPDSTRMEAAGNLAKSGEYTVAVWVEPAPYCMPAVNLFDRRIVLEPQGTDVSKLESGSVGVRAVDDPRLVNRLSPKRVLSPISWANKPIEILSGHGGTENK